MKGKEDCGGPQQDWLSSINKPRGKSNSLSPFDNPERTSNWLLKQIIGNISAATEKSELNENQVLKTAKTAIRKAEKEITNEK